MNLKQIGVGFILSMTLLSWSAKALSQTNQRECAKLPAGNWSVSFQSYTGPAHESSPYQIVSMKMEACNGYLYLDDLQLNIPSSRMFFVIEYSVFVYHASEPNKLILERQIYRMGDGDGDFDTDGIWKTTSGKSWGAPFTAGEEPLMLALMRDGKLAGAYRIELGITRISFGNKEVWTLKGEPAVDRNAALLEAASNDELGDIQSLIAAGADVNTKNQWGATPLIMAANYGYTRSGGLLLSYGADANDQTSDGYSGLILASQYGHLDTVRLLLKSNADLRAKNKDGINALVAAGFNGRSEVWDLLKGAGAEVESSADELACQGALGHTDTIGKMLSDGVDVNAKGSRGDTALLLAALNGHIDTIKFLLDRGADVNRSDQYDWSPLRWALFARHVDIIKTLIKAGADVNAKDVSGITPLISTVKASDVEGAQILIEAGADLSKIGRASC